MLRQFSIVAFVAMIAGIIILFYRGALFAVHPIGIAIQVAAVVLMIAARITFGRRSFHAGADPTAGGLVTTGPYAYVRHPIYAAVIYFTWAGALSHLSPLSVAAAALVTAGAFARMLSEEQLLTEKYPGYAQYKQRVTRIVPFLL
jgi:protein-S-isoprenylcysteine O-methyltransferase Ste14